MPTRGPIVRSLLATGLLCGLVLALAGGVALGAAGVIAVLLAGTVAAGLAICIAREYPGRKRWTPSEAAVGAAAGAIGLLLVVSGTAALAGGVVAAVAVAVSAITAGTVLVVRLPGRGSPPRRPPVPTSGGDRLPTGAVPPVPWRAAPPRVARPDPAGGARLLPPVCELPTDALGREWLLSTAALAGPLEPGVRSSIVGRRQEALDELERRDPSGFARWLATGPQGGSDPAGYVRGGPAAGRDAA